MKTDRHTCPTCRWKHRSPKASNALRLLAYAISFGTIQVLAALHLDGWIAWALWAIAARNALVVVTVTVGLAMAATDSPAFRDSFDRADA